jgi:tRNA modification GTPase
VRLPPASDTISAIATAPGVGAIGVVRVSGPESYRVGDALFHPSRGGRASDLAAGRVTHGRILDGPELIDEALLLTFRAPHSYTAQDVLEFQTHGGPAVLRRVLELTLKHGARLARPGEFTLRAFLNGRLDLVQAESVLGLVNAQSDSARRSAALGLSRALSEKLDSVQSDLTRVYGNLQAVFDYPDEGVPESDFHAPLHRALATVEALLATAQAGRIAQRGARLAIVGRPNAGKSSLLNALLGYERSIVSDLPGTTRDYLEAPLEVGGVPVLAIDTAGIRETDDPTEGVGVAAARRIAEAADLALLLVDSSQPLTPDDEALLAALEPERTLVVASKADLKAAWTRADALPVSAATRAGLDALKEAVRARLLGDAGGLELWISSERHAEALTRVREAVLRALGAPEDLAALDLEDALRALAEMTGRGDIAEEALAHIFANFCVGK